MKTVFENNHSINLLTWEVDPSKRNLNNVISFVLPQNESIKVGDLIMTNVSPESISCYEIISVDAKRKASLSKKDNYRASIKWSSKRPSLKGFNIEKVSNRSLKFLNL
jgi:hypothetical protein